MQDNGTIIEARDEDHFRILKGLLSTKFKDAIKIVEPDAATRISNESWEEKSVQVHSTSPSKPGKYQITHKQARQLRRQGFKVWTIK